MEDRRARLRRRQARQRQIGLGVLACCAAALVGGGVWLADLDGDARADTDHPRTTPGETAPDPSASTGASRTSPQGRAQHQATLGVNVWGGILPGDISPAVRGVRERVYVPNSEDGTVSVINPYTYRVIRTFPTGAYDQHVTPSWDLRWLYVDDTAANQLTVIDPRTSRPVRTIPVADPYNLYFTPDGTKAIVVAESLQRLDFRDPHTWHLIRSVAIPSPGPDHLDFTTNGHNLLISCEFSGTVYRVNTTTMRVTGKATVGGLPIDVKLSPDGRRFYVANQGLGGVTMVDAHTLHILGFIHTGQGAHGLAISRDTRHLYVANRLAGTISVINFHTHHLTATWHVGGSPDMLQVTPNGNQLWASNRYNNTISVINTHTGHLTHTIPVGTSPHGLTLFPQPGHHSLGHNGVYR